MSIRQHPTCQLRVVAEVERPEPGKDFEALGGCDYYYEPLETDRNNEIVVSLNQKISKFPSPSSNNPYDLMDQWSEKLKKYGRWNSSMHVWTESSSLGSFFNEPCTIRKAVYDRILKDLRETFEPRSFRI